MIKYELPPCKFIWSNGGGSYAPLLLKRGAQKMLFFKCPSNHASFADSIYLKVSTRHATYIHNDVHKFICTYICYFKTITIVVSEE